MNPWTIIESLLESLYALCSWRFAVCLFAGTLLAGVVAVSVAAEPLRWILAGAIVAASVLIGLRWDGAH
jgi:lysozyme family protein